MLQHILVTWGPTAKVVGLFVVYVLLMLAVGHRSQIDAWCERNPRRAGIIKVIRGVFPGDPWLIVQGLALLVLKRLPMGYYNAAVNIVPPQVAAAQGVIVTAPQAKPILSKDVDRRTDRTPPDDLPPAA
jgi:hypothetical protein